MHGDNDKLKVYLEHRAALINYATPLTGSRATAEEVVQDAWLRFASASTPRQPAQYLYRIVRNLATDLTRRLSLENRYHHNDDDEPAHAWMAPGPLPEPERSLLNTQQLDEVRKALEALPETTRKALEMHRLGEARLHDIARTLNVSTSTAQRLVHQGLVRIALHLDRANRSASDDTTDDD
ncbi:RNA polymerase sigma factor [Alloalcanivorax dieselolei B5]|uniref:RNA polymerase sigma factor n=1 Tax=Alcanivorax dieselolei (strain DSM 16502 / CGMCC 1.3690 / MCCC 1A00001 / B-5) TaxID=930169 RepID=K0CAK8_ALCDB|nr:sigma-70 family RNA polymerase sigma factor [Alloalcanivorax dieselolei]AFT69658.1 RNA polymerase sigma factor [Alloalcanivorax dieselolei B5]GGK03384.1 DNA-directed RNA polymerase sigma-70 factor [Alloalcanivorax dieselolei]